MKRRTFLKGLLGSAAALATGISVPVIAKEVSAEPGLSGIVPRFLVSRDDLTKFTRDGGWAEDAGKTMAKQVDDNLLNAIEEMGKTLDAADVPKEGRIVRMITGDNMSIACEIPYLDSITINTTMPKLRAL